MTDSTPTRPSVTNPPVWADGVTSMPKVGGPPHTPSMSLVSLMSTTGTSAKRKADQAFLGSVQPSATIKKTRRRWKKPKGKPKRPLSAYNLYFKAERERMLRHEENVKLGFRDMAKLIASKWNNLPQDDRNVYEGPAKEERSKYFTQLAEWKKEQQQKQKDETFDRQMETLYDAFSGSSELDAACDEPLPIVDAPSPPLPPIEPASITTATVPKPQQTSSLANSLQMASDISNDTFKLACQSSPLDESFDPLDGISHVLDDLSDDVMSMNNPEMKRILKSCDVLNSSIDNEFVDFMSSLDWKTMPLESPCLDIQEQ